MADRLPHRRSAECVKAESDEGDEMEEESAPEQGRIPRKAKKKRKKEGGVPWGVLIIFALAAFGAWKLFAAIFG